MSTQRREGACLYIPTNAIDCHRSASGSPATRREGRCLEDRLTRSAYYLTGAVLGIAMLWVAFHLWDASRGSVPETVASSPPERSASVPVAAAPEPPTHYPLDPKLAAGTSATAFDLEAALGELFGARTAQSMFRLDDFPRRLAASVDNLGRPHGSTTLWPVNPAGGRLVVEERDGATFIGADNGLRYTPYVLLLETVDLRRAVAIYARIYPSVQRAYEELGYPGKHFNDRLVEVLDQLLATPESDTPIEVRLPSIEGPLQPERPWVLYEFVDPRLQSLTSGQKLLLRTGSVNERRIKTRLAEIRRLVTTPAAKR